MKQEKMPVIRNEDREGIREVLLELDSREENPFTVSAPSFSTKWWTCYMLYVSSLSTKCESD